MSDPGSAVVPALLASARALAFALFGVTLTVLAPPSNAGTGSPDSTGQGSRGSVAGAQAVGREPSRTAPSRFTFIVGLDRMHDDNILQLPQRGFDRFAQNPSPPRFLVSSLDANMDVFRGDVRWRTRPLPRRETRLAASVDAYAYEQNTVKNWQQYELALRQELTASRRHLTTLELSWNELPDYYLGQITDADASFAAGVTIRHSLSYAQRTLAARLAQEWLRGRLVAGAGFERLKRDYNSDFNERDNHNDEWRFTAGVSPFPNWGASAQVTYLTGALDARGDLASSPIRDADISYDHHGIGASVTLPWGHGDSRGRLEAGLMPEKRTYTTSDKFDLTRFGRSNQRLETTVKAYQHVWGPLEAVASYYRLTSDASFTQGIVFDPNTTDFDQTRIGLMLRGRWELPTR